MCEFISWIEKDGQVLFLTGDDVFYTQRGKELQAYCKSPDDVIGHGAIMFYYNLDHDNYVDYHKECIDFSSPNNFPASIVDAIKTGKMRGLGQPSASIIFSSAVKELLNGPAKTEYQKICDSALAEYRKTHDSAEAEYLKIRASAKTEYQKICDSALAEYRKTHDSAETAAEYQKICDSARIEYQKICASAKTEYQKICDSALAEYQKICDDSFWDLFANPENRNDAWKQNDSH